MDVAESERLKYEKIYQFPGYGSKGHGAPIAEHMLTRAPGRGTLGDFGCGRGGSFQPYLDAGFIIQPVDHVNVVDLAWGEHAQVLPPVVANLWSDKLPSVDYGMCTDVMEHIPEQFVSATLSNISKAVRQGCLWTVCHVQDVWGDRIGERLHMTVRPASWWTAQFVANWEKVEIIQAKPGTTIYWTSHGDLAQHRK
jgi:hypothetical protein